MVMATFSVAKSMVGCDVPGTFLWSFICPLFLLVLHRTATKQLCVYARFWGFLGFIVVLAAEAPLYVYVWLRAE